MAMTFPRFSEFIGRSLAPISQGRIDKRRAEAEFNAQRSIEHQGFLRELLKEQMQREQAQQDAEDAAVAAEQQRQQQGEVIRQQFEALGTPKPPMQRTPQQNAFSDYGQVAGAMTGAGLQAPAMSPFFEAYKPQEPPEPIQPPRGLPNVTPESLQAYIAGGGNDASLLIPYRPPPTPETPPRPTGIEVDSTPVRFNDPNTLESVTTTVGLIKYRIQQLDQMIQPFNESKYLAIGGIDAPTPEQLAVAKASYDATQSQLVNERNYLSQVLAQAVGGYGTGQTQKGVSGSPLGFDDDDESPDEWIYKSRQGR